MTTRCHRALDVDLAAYLEAPDESQWAEFREHLGDCADCSGEVHAWTALRGDLAGGEAEPGAVHVAEEVLLGYADDRDGLSVESVREIESHLAECAACRDEVAVLGAMDAAAIASAADAPEQSVPESAPSGPKVRPGGTERPGVVERPRSAGRPSRTVPPGEPQRPRLADLLAAVGRVVWHPAFAYAIVLLIVIPVSMTTVGLEAPTDSHKAQVTTRPEHIKQEMAASEDAPRSDQAPPLRRSDTALAKELRRESVTDQDEGPGSLDYLAVEREGADTALVLDGPTGAPREPIAAGDMDSREQAHSAATANTDARVQVEPAPAADVEMRAEAGPAAAAAAVGRERLAMAKQQAFAPPSSPHQGQWQSGQVRFAEQLRAALRPEGSTNAGDSLESVVLADADDSRQTMLSFVAGGHDVVSLQNLPVILEVRVPLVVRDGETLPTEARIVDADRRRELRETFPTMDGKAMVTMSVPTAWLTPGRYSIEIRAAGSPGAAKNSSELVVVP